ncbi:hypothetical protein HMPREF3120_11035 [Corynebacterium sp. HMSC11D10]|uniref:hypothetical protein n=1 Tax=Corynebacterium sp. HMSC11D10 TaxID=1581088 RepID=UPI0008A35D75|nr:hypothetical protein [Corynebacterium sp. HMSC11D10]OFU51723.1 hypothetical protein HMPREF3120_11035 [Corynebacterium sp. HMSC11D10]
MNILITTDRISPILGFLLDELKALQLVPSVHFQREDRFLGPELTSPAWAPGVSSLIRQRFYNSGAESLPNLVVALGFEAAVTALERFEGVKLLTVLMHGDLDFSGRNRKRVVQFKSICQASEALVLMNEWDMTKAISHGSTIPQFLWNPAKNSLDLSPFTSASGDVAVVYDSRQRKLEDLRLEPSIVALQEVVDILGVSLRFMESNAFYWYKDFMASRSYSGTVSLRLRGVSHLYFWDDDADSVAAYSGIVDSPHPIVVRPTVGASLTSRTLRRVVVGSPSTWAYRLISPERVVTPVDIDPKIDVGRPFWEILDSVLEGTKVPWFWEDYGDVGSFSLFPSVAAVENRSDGARPQRIRNMFLALSEDSLTIQLNFEQRVLARREKLVREYVSRGMRCDFVYGENSTNPVRAKDSIIMLYRLLDHLSARQATPSAWFVRDLHWLDEEIVSRGSTQEARAAGKFELERISRSFGTILSPSQESARLFNQLVAREIDVQFTNDELPPGVNHANCVRIEGEELGVTLLYSGGIGSAYKMPSYLDAVAQYLLSEDQGLSDRSLLFDFLVRPAEQHILLDELLQRGIADHPDIRILNGDFDSYEPRTQETVGVLLLESAYASQAFPYKSVSYIEKGLRFLAFSGSPVERFFGPSGVVIPCEADVTSLAETLIQLKLFGHGGADWNSIWHEHSWANRLSTARKLAQVADREDP